MSEGGDLLLVGVGVMGRPYIDAARRLGLRVRVVERASRADETRVLVDDLQLTRGPLEEQWAEAAAAAAWAHRPDGVVAFSESQVMAAALVQDQLGLPGPSLRAAVVSRNKALQRAVCGARGIRQPEYLVTPNLIDAQGWAAPRFPVVLKPLSAAGSEGVELVRGAEEFAAAAARRAADGPLLVETAVNGPEYSWEALVDDGEVWFANLSAKDTTGPPYFVETAGRTGIKLPGPVGVAVDRFCRAVIDAIGVRSGLVHLEFNLPGGLPTLIEIAVRTPGDHLMDLLGMTYDVDWFELVLRLAMRIPLPSRPSGGGRWAASLWLAPEPGTIISVDGLDEVRRHPDVVRAEVSARVGDVVPPVRSSADRVGHVVMAAGTAADRDAVLEFVRSTLQVRTTPREPERG